VKEAFRLDIRSLAVARIFAGVLILWDILDRASNLTAHYTSTGVIPATAVFEIARDKAFFSVHMANDSWEFMLCLFALHFLAAASLTVGYQTRIATFLCWYLNTSLHHRNPLINIGGDILLKFLLLWCIFLPWGAAWSVDKVLKRQPDVGQTVLTPASVVLVLQMVLLYLSSVLNKWHHTWTEDGTALYYALSVDHLTTPYAIHLYQRPELMKWLTFAVLWGELIGAIALLLPFARLRIPLVLSFLFMHYCFGLFLELGLFRYAPMVGLIALLPSMFWEKVNLKVPVSFEGLKKRLQRLPKGGPDRAYGNDKVVALFLLAAFGYGVLTCLQGWLNRPVLPRPANQIGTALGLNQHWPMFIYLDKVKDGWYVIEAELEDGTVLDLIHGGEPNFDKPTLVSATYDGVRWRRFMTNVIMPPGQPYLPWYSEYIRRHWNEQNPNRKIQKLTLIFMDDPQHLHYRYAPPEKKFLHIWEASEGEDQ
jgi:hypothetical protein